MVGDAVLRKIVSPDFFFATTRSDLTPAMGRVFLRFFTLFGLEQTRAQNVERFFLVLCWLRPSWQRTIVPVGICKICTAESVVFTPWPPGPPERQTSMRSSSGFNSRSISSASGKTATVAVLV